MLTGDQSLVELAATIQYRVADLRAFHFAVREPDRMLKTWPKANCGNCSPPSRCWPTRPIDKPLAEVLTDGRASLEQQLRDRLQQRVDALGLGIEVLPQGVCLQEIHPPLAVVDAFRDVSSAFKEMARLKNEAEGFYRDRLIKAAGDEAYRELSAAGAEVNDELWQRLQPELAGEAAAELNVAQAFADGQTADGRRRRGEFCLGRSGARVGTAVDRVATVRGNARRSAARQDQADLGRPRRRAAPPAARRPARPERTIAAAVEAEPDGATLT